MDINVRQFSQFYNYCCELFLVKSTLGLYLSANDIHFEQWTIKYEKGNVRYCEISIVQETEYGTYIIYNAKDIMQLMERYNYKNSVNSGDTLLLNVGIQSTTTTRNPKSINQKTKPNTTSVGIVGTICLVFLLLILAMCVVWNKRK